MTETSPAIGFRTRASAVAVTMFDQAVWSLGTFVGALFVGRFLGLEALGEYAIGSAVLFSIGDVHMSLVVSPAAYFGPTLYASKLGLYTRGLLVATAWAGVALAVASIPFWWVAEAMATGSVYGVVAAALLTSSFVFEGWVARQIAYVQSRPGVALAGSTVYLLIVSSVVITLQLLGVLTVQIVFLVFAVGAMAQTLTVLAALRLDLRRPARRHPYRSMLRPQWDHGKWLLGAASIRWAGAEGFTVFAVSLIVSVASLGGLRGAQTLIRPVGLLFVALGTFFVPRMAAMAAGGDAGGVLRTARLLRLAFFGFGAVGVLLSVPFGGLGLDFLFGDEFREFGWIVSALFLGVAANGIAEADGMTLRAVGYPRGQFMGFVWKTATQLAIGIPLALLYGLAGIVVSIVIAIVSRTIVLRVISRRHFLERRVQDVSAHLRQSAFTSVADDPAGSTSDAPTRTQP